MSPKTPLKTGEKFIHVAVPESLLIDFQQVVSDGDFTFKAGVKRAFELYIAEHSREVSK